LVLGVLRAACRADAVGELAYLVTAGPLRLLLPELRCLRFRFRFGLLRLVRVVDGIPGLGVDAHRDQVFPRRRLLVLRGLVLLPLVLLGLLRVVLVLLLAVLARGRAGVEGVRFVVGVHLLRLVLPAPAPLPAPLLLLGLPFFLLALPLVAVFPRVPVPLAPVTAVPAGVVLVTAAPVPAPAAV